MLYIFHGNDREKIISKSTELIESLLKKRPDANVFHIENPNIEEYLESQGLFVQKYIVVGENILAEIENIKGMQESPNIFIFKEEKIDKKIKADKIIELNKAEKKDDYNIFSITNVLDNREKLWLAYRKAKMKGIADEQIHGVMFWKLKTINSPRLGSFVDVYHEARRGGDMEILMERWILGK